MKLCKFIPNILSFINFWIIKFFFTKISLLHYIAFLYYLNKSYIVQFVVQALILLLYYLQYKIFIKFFHVLLLEIQSVPIQC